MSNEKAWKSLINEIKNMSEDEFTKLVEECDKDVWGLDSLDLSDCEEFYQDPNVIVYVRKPDREYKVGKIVCIYSNARFNSTFNTTNDSFEYSPKECQNNNTIDYKFNEEVKNNLSPSVIDEKEWAA